MNSPGRHLKILLGAVLCVVAWTARGYCDLSSVSVAVNKTPTDFYTGKTIQPGDVAINIVTTAPGNGLENWMTVKINLVSSVDSTPIAGALSVSTLNLTPGFQPYKPTFQCQTPFTGNSVRFQVTVSSPDGSTLTPTSGTNPTYSSVVNVYDLVTTTVAIVQAPDPSNALFNAGEDVNPSGGPYGVNVLVQSTESSVGFGPESFMRVKIELIDFNNRKITGGLSQEDFVPGTDFILGSSTNHPSFSPRFASYGQTLRYRVTVSSANGQVLVPQNGVNPSTSAYFSVNAGTPTKIVLLPMNAPLIRPDPLGRSPYGSSTPFFWLPTALGEQLRIKAFLTDAWSNPVDLPNTQLQFSATQYLTLPAFNSAGTWILDGGIQGTEFLFSIDAWQTPVPVTVNSAFSQEQIFVEKTGLPTETIFVGPSPFNPKTGTTTFGFQVSQDRDMKILVVDLFGQEVWETTVHATANLMNMTPWDGRNSKGDMVAAGIYWVILEKDGQWGSKKKFGVIK